MFRAKKRYRSTHLPIEISMKAARNLLRAGLQIMAAKPVCNFHQTLSFPKPVRDANQAKAVFTKFMKNAEKRYRKNGMATFYVQERRCDGAIHYHVCFLFCDLTTAPYCPSTMERQFRASIFKKWNAANGGGCVNAANELKRHPEFNLKSLAYLVKTMEIPDSPPARAETIWWGVRNGVMLNHRAPDAATKKEVAATFKALFSKRRELETEKSKAVIEQQVPNNLPDESLPIVPFTYEHPEDDSELCDIPF